MYNNYGLEFADYNSDGYTDMSIRRFPGEYFGAVRTHFYWLWNNDKQRFIYDWKLSEEVTESNLIDFSVTQSVHEGLEPMVFRLLGRMIEAPSWDDTIEEFVEVADVKPNIHIIQVMNGKGEIITEI